MVIVVEVEVEVKWEVKPLVLLVAERIDPFVDAWAVPFVVTPFDAAPFNVAPFIFAGEWLARTNGQESCNYL